MEKAMRIIVQAVEMIDDGTEHNMYDLLIFVCMNNDFKNTFAKMWIILVCYLIYLDLNGV